MTITRHASAGARRTWFRPAPRCLLGTTAGPDAAPAQRPGSKQVAHIAAAIVAIAALAAAGVAERAAVAASFAVLGHLHWLWIPAAVLLESASMAAFAVMLRRLVAVGGASVGVRPMLATAYAANAVLAVSIRATGATVPWHDLLLVYSSGIATQSVSLKPGGLGVTEGTLSLALVATAGSQPGPGGGAALPPGQFLAGRTGRMARAAVATASPRPARHRTAPRPAMQPGRSGDPSAPRHARPGDKPAQRTAQEQDTRHDR